MSSIVQTFQKRTQTLPLSSKPQPQPSDHQQDQGLLRRRLSSLSYRIQPLSVASPAATWNALRRSKSVGENAGASIRAWWARGWAWILARKPTFASDLEMNDEESKALGPTCRGTLRHVLFKLRSEIRRLRSTHHSLPLSCRYNSFDYSKNFDNGTDNNINQRTRLVS